MSDAMAAAIAEQPLLPEPAPELNGSHNGAPPWIKRAQERLAEGRYPEFAAWLAWFGERLECNPDRLMERAGPGMMVGLFQAMRGMSEYEVKDG